MLQIDDLTFRIAGRPLFEGTTARVPAGHHVGLVGRNGAGKSTLFKLILNEMSADGGSIRIRPAARVGMVAQEAPGGDQSLLDFVLEADVERASLLREAETAEDPMRIAEIHTRLADIGAHAAPARAALILSGLGFDTAAQATPLGAWSGGWRMRVALAAVLFSEPDLLLLDEPSNHLDLEAVLWLEAYLKTYKHTFILISHDRNVLNAAVTHILHLENRKLTLYTGGYDDFVKMRAEKQAQAQASQAKQAAERAHLQSFVDRFRAKASKAAQAQSRMKRLAKMEPVVLLESEGHFNFRFPDPEELSPPLITLDGVSVGYDPAKPVLRKLDLRIDPDDRIALLGANGNGKSTFSRLISGRLAPLSGKKHHSGKLRVGYFAQHQAEELHMNETPFQHMAELMKNELPSKVRGRIAQFGFSGQKADTVVAKLSGGEKARLLFALMSYAAPHIMILDEPTNHLDVEGREALISAINDYAGAVIIVSHDRHILDMCADALWIVEDGAVKPFDGDLDAYERLLLEKRRGDGNGARDERSSADRREERRAGAKARANLAPIRKEAQTLERAIAKLDGERQEIEKTLADPKIYSGPADRLATLVKRQGELKAEIASAEARWLELQEALESAA